MFAVCKAIKKKNLLRIILIVTKLVYFEGWFLAKVLHSSQYPSRRRINHESHFILILFNGFGMLKLYGY